MAKRDFPNALDFGLITKGLTMEQITEAQSQGFERITFTTPIDLSIIFYGEDVLSQTLSEDFVPAELYEFDTDITYWLEGVVQEEDTVIFRVDILLPDPAEMEDVEDD